MIPEMMHNCTFTNVKGFVPSPEYLACFLTKDLLGVDGVIAHTGTIVQIHSFSDDGSQVVLIIGGTTLYGWTPVTNTDYKPLVMTDRMGYA
jgi:hypothetical protein